MGKITRQRLRKLERDRNERALRKIILVQEAQIAELYQKLDDFEARLIDEIDPATGEVIRRLLP